MESKSSDNFLLICFAGGMILLLLAFGTGAVKGIIVPSAASLLQSGPPAQGNSVIGSPTIPQSFIDQVLCKYSSPACGTGGSLYSLGQQSNVDPAFALAVFWNESGFGRAGMAAPTRSLGNLRCIPSAACWNGYAAFSSWPDGYRSFYALISGPVYEGSGREIPLSPLSLSTRLLETETVHPTTSEWLSRLWAWGEQERQRCHEHKLYHCTSCHYPCTRAHCPVCRMLATLTPWPGIPIALVVNTLP